MMEFENRIMCLRFLLSCVVCVLCFSNTVDSKLSDYITICKAKDPALEKCMIEAGHKLLRQMEKGIPEYDITPVDPMAVPRLGIQRSDIGMALILTNSTHRGFSHATIHKAKADPSKQLLEFEITLPSYSIIGHYDVNGKVMLLPIKGNGDSNITLYDINVTWKIQGEPETRDGKVYMKLKEFDVNIQPKLMRVHFDNLFNGNQLLGDTMNNLLNDHWSDIYRRIKPALEQSYSELLMNFANKIFSKTPYNEIFTE